MKKIRGQLFQGHSPIINNLYLKRAQPMSGGILFSKLKSTKELSFAEQCIIKTLYLHEYDHKNMLLKVEVISSQKILILRKLRFKMKFYIVSHSLPNCEK